MSCLEHCFGSLDDPRADNSVYRLGDLIVIMLAASLCGATTATDFALFAHERKSVLNRLVSYERAPSHDTFSRLLRLLDRDAFGQAFVRFADGFAKALGSSAVGHDVLAVDGKALRRAYEKGFAASPPMTVSVFAARTRLCLAAVGQGPESNEVEAALQVIQLIDLTDKIITADALHCHHRMAETIVARNGHYVLALKGNRHDWLAAAQSAFDEEAPAAHTHEQAHGRTEWRKAEVLATKTALMKGHAAFIRLTTQRDQAEPVTRFFMASFVMTPQAALAITRSHWMVENGLHWMLDVHLGEDMSRARKDHAPANVALLTRLAKNILQMVDEKKVPISHRIKKCNWNDDYLIKAITHMQ